MKVEVKKWLSKSKFGIAIALLLVLAMAMPMGAASPPVFTNIAGVYNVKCNIPVYYLNGTKVMTVKTATLTIDDNTVTSRGVITNATLEVPNVGDIHLVGFVGMSPGRKISLVGYDNYTAVNINGKVNLSSGAAHTITGRIDGWAAESGGELGYNTDSTVAWSVADSHGGSVSALLTHSINAGSTYVQVTPPTGIKLSDIDTITSGWGFWYNMQVGTAWGPQMELRFVAPTNVNPDGVGHVDVTIANQVLGTGNWTNLLVTGAGSQAMYYGNDPWDGTAFDGPIMTLSAVEAAINAEAAMIANGGFTCGTWTLSRVRIETWEGVVRTCYIDDISVKKGTAVTSYSFEPLSFAGTFSGHKV